MTRATILLLMFLALAGTALADAYSDFKAAREAGMRGDHDLAIYHYTRAIECLDPWFRYSPWRRIPEPWV